MQVAGFWACLGGEEIKRASATLAGPVQQVDDQVTHVRSHESRRRSVEVTG